MIIAFYIISIIIMILLPPILAAVWRRRFETLWILFSVGALTFGLSQVVHIPLNNWLASLGLLPHEAGADQPVWQTALILGLTAGLCEELARTAGYALLRKARSFADGVMLGIGHGGFEAMTFGAVQLAAAIVPLTALLQGDPSGLANAPEQIALAQAQPWLGLVPILERVLVIGIHITFSVMVLRAFQMRNPVWVVLAIVYHAAIDAGAVYIALNNLITNQWAFEGAFALMALPGYVFLYWSYRQQTAGLAPRPVSPLNKEWGVFALAVRKELLQAWRTKRVLVVGAVFVLFGLMSPLLAYFTPQMLTMIPGGEAFQDLIPAPNMADSMLQYIKNLTTFGFIMALLMGMGAVAGEKERGTASLILSKPMTRWAFVSSKLAAQILVYLFGFGLGAFCCYFYTLVLFGSLNVGPFLALNLVLLAWMLPFTGLSLVGSVVGKTSSAAAGAGLVLIIALMIAGTLPGAGSVLPGALVSWASQLGNLSAGMASLTPGSLPMDAPNLANGAALASSVVILVLSLLVSIGLFEQQELE